MKRKIIIAVVVLIAVLAVIAIFFHSGTDTGIDMTEGEEEKCPYRLSEMILQK